MLGAGQEVGRSCCVLKYRGKTIVCDAGVHPAHHGIASLPFLDELDWSTVDAVLVTQYVVLDLDFMFVDISKLSFGSCSWPNIYYGEGAFLLLLTYPFSDLNISLD